MTFWGSLVSEKGPSIARVWFKRPLKKYLISFTGGGITSNEESFSICSSIIIICSLFAIIDLFFEYIVLLMQEPIQKNFDTCNLQVLGHFVYKRNRKRQAIFIRRPSKAVPPVATTTVIYNQ